VLKHVESFFGKPQKIRLLDLQVMACTTASSIFSARSFCRTSFLYGE
jgi:hypothetical protein